MDFKADNLEDGRVIRQLNAFNHFHREGLGIKLDFSLPAERIIRGLNRISARHNRTVQQEWLDQYMIESIIKAQDFATQRLNTYNNDRPPFSLTVCALTARGQGGHRWRHTHPKTENGYVVFTTKSR